MASANEIMRNRLGFLPMIFGWAHALNHRIAIDFDALDQLCIAAGLRGWVELDDAFSECFFLLKVGRDAAIASVARDEDAAHSRAMSQFGPEGSIAKSLLVPIGGGDRPLHHNRILITDEAVCDADAGHSVN